MGRLIYIRSNDYGLLQNLELVLEKQILEKNPMEATYMRLSSICESLSNDVQIEDREKLFGYSKDFDFDYAIYIFDRDQKQSWSEIQYENFHKMIQEYLDLVRNLLNKYKPQTENPYAWPENMP